MSKEFAAIRACFMKRASAPNVSPYAFKLGYLIAFKYMNQESRTAFVAQDTLTRDLNVSVRTVQRLIDILQPLGLVLALGHGPNRATTYWIEPEKATPVSPIEDDNRTPVSPIGRGKGDTGDAKRRHPRREKATPVSPLLNKDSNKDSKGRRYISRPPDFFDEAKRTPEEGREEKNLFGEAVGAAAVERVRVKGCKTIYAPEGQAAEYAPLACNPYRGCGHGCAYCYVPLITKQDRKEFDAGANLRPTFLDGLLSDAKKYQAAGITEQVLLSFTTDPYHPGDTTPTRRTLEILIEHGMGICVLTKGGTRALRDLDLFRPDRDAFACTLTSLDDQFSKKWERNAALPGDRIAALKAFHDAGIFTWVSLEPVLDVEATLAVIAATHEFVDLYKVGRVNYSKLTRTIDWRDFTGRVVELLNRVGASHYIKKDLQPFLPAGYPNPLRVPQHHDVARHDAAEPTTLLRDEAKPDADAAFDEFWSVYPKRKAKLAARTAFDRAIKNGVEAATLIEGARRYAGERAGQDPKFTKHPATWLRGGCWEDEPAPRAGGPPTLDGLTGEEVPTPRPRGNGYAKTHEDCEANVLARLEAEARHGY